MTPSPTATATPYTTQGFANVVATVSGSVSKVTGVSEADLHHLVESQLYHDKLLAALAAEVPTTANQVHARHILVKDLLTAQVIVQKLSTGGDFVALAAQFSTDTATKDNAGDLGWFGKGEQDPTLDTVVFTQTVGAVSAPIQSQASAGYQIVQVIERGQHPLNPLALANARSAALQTWLDSQRSVTLSDGRTLVQIYDNWQSDVPTSPSISTTQ